MERSVIREQRASELIVPGFRSAHPGYACLQRLIWMPIGPTADFI
jgi:hypothetical protein